MKYHLAGFFISALLHLGVAGLLINLDINEASKISEPEQVPLTLAMFQPEPIKPVPVAEVIPEKVKPDPIVEPVAKPVVAESTPIEPESESVKKVAPKPEVTPIPIAKKEPEPVKKLIKPKKKKVVKPKPVKKKRKVVKKKKQAKVVRKSIVKKVKPKVVQKKKPVTPLRKIVRKSPVRQAKAIKQVTKSAAKVVKVPTKPSLQAPKPALNSAKIAHIESVYKARLRQLIVANKRYPKRAKRRRQQGTVRVSFVVYANGIIKNIRAVNSSGHIILDKAAISSIEKISGKLPFPPDLKRTQWVITVPVAYQLR
jgi:protein TonB